jgi:predicted nucleotidyltransferase
LLSVRQAIIGMTIAPGIEFPEAALAEICRKYKIQELMVFGSAARGEMRPDSDVDLLVEFMPDAEMTLFKRFDVEMELANLIGRKVDLVSKKAMRPRIRREVMLEARLIYAA